MKISRISNPKSPLWNLVKFRRAFFLINASRIVCWMLSFGVWINGKTIKAPGLCNSTHILHLSSSTEIQYLQIVPSEKGTHTNQSMMFKEFYLYEFFRWTKCMWWAMVNNHLLVYNLFVILCSPPQSAVQIK